MHILKFGGTSMGDDQSWQRVMNIILRYDQPFVIVSATARTTRKLLASAEMALGNLDKARRIADEIKIRHLDLVTAFLDRFSEADPHIREQCKDWIEKKMKELHSYLSDIHRSKRLDPRQKDAVASLGEQLSSYLFARCCKVSGFETEWVDAADIIRTNSEFGQAQPDTGFINEKANQLISKLANGQLPVMGGYYGRDSEGNATTLGFEGSDYTASLVGAALDAESIEIWTDVSGVYTCDPRYVEDAGPIAELSFQEATELAYFGAKVLHPSTTKPAASEGIPIRVKNIFEPDAPGTRISHQITTEQAVKAISFKDNGVIITVTSTNTVMGYEFLAGVFSSLRSHHLPVDVVTTTEASVSIAIEETGNIDALLKEMGSYGTVELLGDKGMISLVGCRRDGSRELINRVLENIEGPPPALISFSHNKGNLNLVLEKDQVLPSVRKIHRTLFA